MEAEVTKTPNSIDDIKRKDKFTGTVVKTMLGGAVIDFRDDRFKLDLDEEKVACGCLNDECKC